MRLRRNKHNLSHYRLFTGDMGKLIPCGLVEVLPGDTFRHSTSAVVRLSPLAAPVMHPSWVRIHHFFVPHRLIWPTSGGTFEEFITGGDDGNDAQAVNTMPTTSSYGDLQDYFGLPRVAGIDVSSLPIRGFNRIYNEYYRDQDLVTEKGAQTNDVPNIAWEKDYFTSARPWTQKGSAVNIPLGTYAPVRGIGANSAFVSGNVNVKETGGVDSTWNPTVSGTAISLEEDLNNTGYPNIYADLSSAAAAQVNDIRRAFALQRFQEARARYGSRYTEYLRYLGITPSDARLDRPEYLGGGRTRLAVSEVLQSAPETGTGPSNSFGVGDMYGHGIAAMRSNAYQRFFEEHGYVISCFSVRPKTMYQNGIHRTFLRQYREDFFQRELQFIGQQEVYQGEIYADNATLRDTFGYQDRYREYREHPSGVSGDFRDTRNLDHWHQGRAFGSAPTLNSSFIECDATKRIHNVTSEPALWVMVQHNIAARRMVARTAAGKIF